MIEASRLGGRLFRNNVGLAAYPKTSHKVRYGLCSGSADLIGWTPDGRFWAVEVKAPGWVPTPKWLRSDQNKFLSAVRSAGGIGVVVTSVSELEVCLRL